MNALCSVCVKEINRFLELCSANDRVVHKQEVFILYNSIGKVNRLYLSRVVEGQGPMTPGNRLFSIGAKSLRVIAEDKLLAALFVRAFFNGIFGKGE